MSPPKLLQDLPIPECVAACEKTVRGPGAFEGSPRYTPWFVEWVLEGDATEAFFTLGGSEVSLFEPAPEDTLRFPELKDVYRVAVFSDSNGFWYGKAFSSEAGLQSWRSEHEESSEEETP